MLGRLTLPYTVPLYCMAPKTLVRNSRLCHNHTCSIVIMSSMAWSYLRGRPGVLLTEMSLPIRVASLLAFIHEGGSTSSALALIHEVGSTS